MNRILVCDDERDIVKIISVYLKGEGYQVYSAYNGQEALEILEKEKIDLVILDVMMPVKDGIETAIEIREKMIVPIIMLSAKSEETDKILGLNVGADDYVTKPFTPLELLARVKSQLRRYKTLGCKKVNENTTTVERCRGIVIDDRSKTVTVEGEVVKLTPIEYKILLFLMKNKGVVFSSVQIYEACWNEEAAGVDNVVAVHIRHLREKIEIDPKDPRYIKVLWGLGYKFEDIS